MNYFMGNTRSQVLGISLAVLFSLGAAEQASFAANDWCLKRHASKPCGGVQGKCVKNTDGTRGGFVASTAKLLTKGVFTKTQAYIGIDAQVCGESLIGLEVQIRDKAVVNNSDIRGAVRITDTAMVDNVNIMGTVRIGEQAVVKGQPNKEPINGKVTIKGNAQVIGTNIAANKKPDGLGVRIDGGRILDSTITDDVSISGGTIVESTLTGKAQITGNPKIVESNIDQESSVGGNADLNRANLTSKAKAYDRAVIRGDSKIEGSAQVYGDATVLSKSEITGSAQVYGDAKVKGATVTDNAHVYDQALLNPGSHVSGNVRVYQNGAVNGRVEGDLHITRSIRSEKLAGRIFQEATHKYYIGKSPVSCEKSNLTAELREVNGNIEKAYDILAFFAQNEKLTQVDTLIKHFSKNPEQEIDCCQLCTEPLEVASLTSCEHLFCRNCVVEIIQQAENAHGDKPPEEFKVFCPMCKQNIIERPRQILNIRKDPGQGFTAEEGERPKLRNFDSNPSRFNRFRGPEMN